MNSDNKNLILQHQNALDKVASEKTKLWWEKYMKGVIPFRGVGIPKNRELLGEWRTRNGIDKYSYEDQFDLALLFFKEPIAEDKLAGILYIQKFLLNNISWELQVDKYDKIFQERLIFDWNVCDWFCVRVLGELIKNNGKDCAVAISRWSNAHYLWQARASVVSFVNMASEFEYYPIIKASCEILLKREERFSKTAVGWVLRDISKHDTRFVISFIEKYLKYFTSESLKNALKYYEKEIRDMYLKKI